MKTKMKVTIEVQTAIINHAQRIADEAEMIEYAFIVRKKGRRLLKKKKRNKKKLVKNKERQRVELLCMKRK